MIFRAIVSWRFCSRSVWGGCGRHTVMFGCIVTLLFLVGSAWAETVEFQVIEGALIAPCQLSCGDISLPANVLIDLGTPIPLLLHGKTGVGLELTENSRVDVRFDKFSLDGLATQTAELVALEDLTREHAGQLEEIPVVAIVGLSAFSNYRLDLQVSRGQLDLYPLSGPEPQSNDLPVLPEMNTENLPRVSDVAKYNQEKTGYWLTAIGPENKTLRVRLATSLPDTLIDRTAATEAGASSGEICPVILEGIDISRFVPFRVEDLRGGMKDAPDIILGTDLLEFFQVRIDPEKQEIQFAVTRTAEFDKLKQRYFQARAQGDADALEKLLVTLHDVRLADEAAEKLLHLRMETASPDATALKRAFQAVADATPPARRSMKVLVAADELLASKHKNKYELTKPALRMALTYAPDDTTGMAIYEVQSRLGFIALREGNLKQAHKYLLSASFGMPREPYINLWLGQLYEQKGKLVRAWSRYVQSIIVDEPARGGFAGLDRLNRNAEFRRIFNMNDALELLEGRLPVFHPSSRFGDQQEDASLAPVRLVELFTCIEKPDTMAAELALGALGEYFENKEVCLVSYHQDKPYPDPLLTPFGVARRTYYQITDIPTAVFDGTGQVTGGGDDTAMSQLFPAYISKSVQASESPWQIDIGVGLAGQSLSVATEVSGPASPADARLHLLLCERAVMSPGRNTLLLHPYVVRACLTPVEGRVISDESESRHFTVMCDLAEVSFNLEKEILNAQERFGIKFMMKPSQIDVSQLEIVAFLQDNDTHRIMSAWKTAPEYEPSLAQELYVPASN